MSSNILKAIEQQLTQAIKYIKSDFPQQYENWHQSHKGQKQFQTHLNVVQYIFTNEKYSTLRTRILDQLLIKLRFFSINQSYLINFEAYLMEKFIKFINSSLALVYKFKDIYCPNNKITKQKQQTLVFQRLSIFFQCLINLLKFSFTQSKPKQSLQNNPRFTNQMIKHQQPTQIQIVSKSFVIFILNILSLKLDQVFEYDIMNVKNIYPQFFSILSDGFLTFKGGSKFIQICGKIITKIVDKNSINIWKQYSEGQQRSNLMKGLKQLNNKMKESINGHQSYKKEKKPDKGNKQSVSFEQICKQRLVLFLQRLLLKFGYNLNISQDRSDTMLYEQSENVLSGNRVAKMGDFIKSLSDIATRSCFNMIDQQPIKVVTHISPADNKILLSLAMLSIEFMDLSVEGQTPFLLTLLSNQSSSLESISFIRENLYQLFMQKFKLLLNKNRTISTQKTMLLKQLAKLVQFVDFSKMQSNQFQTNICYRLKQLFKPTQSEINKPLIIAIDQNNRLQPTTIGQAIPLTPLSPYHSFISYPITLNALKQSLKFQQSRHLLDEVRLFGWFENQQTNLNTFKLFIQGFDFNSKLTLLEYFLQQLIKTKIKQDGHFYALQMSLAKFYQLLTLQFYIDTLLNKQSGILNYDVYITKKSLYQKSIMQKLHMIHTLMTTNIDLKRLLISSKQEELLIFWTLRIMYNINSFFHSIQAHHKPRDQLKLLHNKMLIAEHLIINLSHQTYLLQLFLTSATLQFAAPNTIAQTLKPIQSTLIHRNAGSSVTRKQCNLQFMKNLIKITILKPEQAQQLALIYLSKDFITNPQANSLISLIFPLLTPETMRKCLLSMKNWPIIFSVKSNIQLLNNQPLMQEPKEGLFHANDNDNVTVSNALGVIVLQLGHKWVTQLEFSNPRKQILIDAMINLIGVNDKLILWKRFFFQNILRKIIKILKQIQSFISQKSSDEPDQKGRRILLYERIDNKIYSLLSAVPVEYFKYSTQINQKIRESLESLKQIVEKEYMHLKRECFVHQRYQFLDRYKMTNSLLDKINTGLTYKEQNQNTVPDSEETNIEDIKHSQM